MATQQLVFLLIIVCIIGFTASNQNFKCNNYEQFGQYKSDFYIHDYEQDIQSFQYKGSIKQLKLNKANIKYIRENLFKGFTNLTHLTIIDSEIEDIEKDAFSHLPNLQYLDLSKNKLSKIANYMLEEMIELKKLILNDNLIKIIDSSEFSNLTNLRELQLKNNDLKSIFGNTFLGLPNLEIIDLSGNPIRYIQDKAFDSCKSLKQLILENPKQIIIKSIWSSPSNFELVIVNSIESVEDMLTHVIRTQYDMSAKAMDRGPSYYKNNQSSGIEMPMIITLTIAVIFIFVLAIGISIYLKKKYSKNTISEVATINNGS